MKRLTATLCLTIAVLLGSAGVSESADYQKGYSAYLSGDYATALLEWTPLAEQGDARAQTLLSSLFSVGKGTPQHYKKALKWYTLVALQGNRIAQQKVGVMYQNGEGVPQDYKTAVKWYRLAAEQGNAAAQFNLGRMYALGQGVIEDRVYAHLWANLAASDGNENGAKVRDLIAKLMTPTQLEKAQDLARECVRKKYKGC